MKRRRKQSFVVNVEPTQYFKPHCCLRKVNSSSLEWLSNSKSNREWIHGRERGWSDGWWL